MADKKFMVDLPDPSRPGEFFEYGPVTAVGALEYLQQWFSGASREALFGLFATELEGAASAESLAEEEPRPPGDTPPIPDPGAARYTHDCPACTFEGRFGRYDAYFCRAGGDEYATALLRYGHEGSQYKSRPRHLHERGPDGFPEAAVYTAVFAKHPRKEGA